MEASRQPLFCAAGLVPYQIQRDRPQIFPEDNRYAAQNRFLSRLARNASDGAWLACARPAGLRCPPPKPPSAPPWWMAFVTSRKYSLRPGGGAHFKNALRPAPQRRKTQKSPEILVTSHIGARRLGDVMSISKISEPASGQNGMGMGWGWDGDGMAKGWGNYGVGMGCGT